MKKSFSLLVLLILCMSLGFSQQRTGNIYGTAVDNSGEPLPGVTIYCISDLIGQMSFITTAKGEYRFLSLSPGAYELRAELAGFATYRREKILVQTGSNVTIKIEMVPESLQEEVTVTAASPIVDTKKTTIALTLTVDELQSLPTARDPWVILELSPGVVMDRENVGGSESGQQSTFVSRGVGRSSTNWNVDGIDTTDQVAEGAASQYYDFDAFEEIQIQTAANDITAFTAGAQVNLVTKRGSNRLSAGGRFYHTSQSFQSENTPADFDLEANKVDSISDYGFNIGGPIFKDKLWFWGGFGYQDIKVMDVAGVTIKQQLPNIVFKLNAFFGKHRLEGFFNFANSLKQGRVASSSIDAWEARYNQTGPKPIIKIQDEITFSDNLFISLKGSYAGFGFKLTPIGGFDVIPYRDRATGRYWNTYRYGSDYGRDQFFYQAMGVFFVDDLFGASHEFKFGTEYKNSYGQRDRQYQDQYLYYRDYEAGTTYRAYIYRNSNYDYRINRFGAFLQDSIRAGRFTINASLRYDRQWSFINDVTVPGTNVDWAGDNNLPSVTVSAKDLNVIWNTFSPRLGIIYDITGDGKTTAKLNFGIYGDRYDSSFPGSLASTWGYVYWNWNDRNHDGLASADEVSRPRVRDQFKELDPDDLYDPNMTSPKTMEITVGIERELFDNVGIGGTFIYRKNYNDYWSLNYVDDGGTLRLPQPSDWVLGGNIPAQYGGYPWYEYTSDLGYSSESYTFQRPDFHTRYIGIEFSFKKRFSSSSRWMVNGSFTFQDWKRFYPTRASYNDPTNIEQLDGNYAGYISGSSAGTDQSMNPRWMGKLGFAVRLPLDINFGGTLIARDGYILRKIYQELDIERSDANNNDTPSVYSAPYGTYRLSNFAMLNLQLSKVIRVQRASFTLSIDLFNVFNTNTVTSQEDVITKSNYEQIYKYVSPRIFRLGLRFKF